MVKIFEHDEEDEERGFWVPVGNLELPDAVDVPDEVLISPEEEAELTHDKRVEEAEQADRGELEALM